METEKALLITRGMMVAGLLLAIVAIVGELLGWWNDVGEILLAIATIVGTLGGVASLIIGSSSEEVRTVHETVQENGATLRSVDGKLDKLDAIDEDLDKLDKLDAIDDDLDKVQVQLDTQTGVLGRQVDLLTEIRDRI